MESSDSDTKDNASTQNKNPNKTTSSPHSRTLTTNNNNFRIDNATKGVRILANNCTANGPNFDN